MNVRAEYLRVNRTNVFFLRPATRTEGISRTRQRKRVARNCPLKKEQYKHYRTESINVGKT